MAQTFKTQSDTTAWLQSMEIQNYTLIHNKQYGFIVNVKGSVSIANKNLKNIPVQFGVIEGDFDCGYNKLTSLMGGPQKLSGNYICWENRLTSLQGSPSIIPGDFFCTHNCLKTLYGGPQRVSLDFSCAHNHLTNLQFCPKIVGGIFSCAFNNVVSLEFMPQSVGNEFYCNANKPLSSACNITATDFQFFYQIHNELIQIKKENKRLKQSLHKAITNNTKKFKI